MTAHLTLPYKWVDCNETATCSECTHLNQTAEELNSYPQEWVKELIPKNFLGSSIVIYDNEGHVNNSTGPAVEYGDGTLEWWQNDKPHREDGPAVIRANGETEYYVHGRQVIDLEEIKKFS